MFFHQRQQIGTAGERFSLSPFVAEQRNGLFFRGWACIFEFVHQPLPPFFANAASTRLGVSGSVETRTPMALATAFDIAAPGELVGGSPRPIGPRSSYPLPCLLWTL